MQERIDTYPRNATDDEQERTRERARSRFGGLDVPASMCGMLVAVGMLVLLAGIVSAAIGTIAFQDGVTVAEGQDVTLAGLIGGGIVLFLSFLIGGWAAGRMSRYSGALNGLMTAVWFLLIAVILAALGAWVSSELNLFDDLQVASARLPDWFNQDTMTLGATISAVAFVIAMLIGGLLGGLWGERLHRRADRVLTEAQRGETVTRTVYVPESEATERPTVVHHDDDLDDDHLGTDGDERTTVVHEDDRG